MNKHPRKAIDNNLPVPKLLERAEQGDADCQYWAGLRYFQGDGLPEDQHKAVDYCTLAADNGDARAYAFLAYCASRGIGMSKSIRKSTKMYRISAKAGYAPAQYSLGLFYLNGQGLKKNVRTAITWFEKAAQQKYTHALVMLGNLYHRGEEVVQFDQKAFGYYRTAANHGSPEAKFMLSKLLMCGFGTTADPLTALNFLDESAAAGFGPAIKMKAHFDEYLNFDPGDSGFQEFPLNHPFPLRRRTAIGATYLGEPCYQAMARDIMDYVREFPEHKEAALRDVEVLIKESSSGFTAPLPIFWWQE
jgi:hypothetical protein